MLSCNKEKPIETPKEAVEKPISEKPLPKKIGDYMSDEKDIVWTAKHSDTSPYLCEIVFQEDFAVYRYHGQCIYWYFTNHYHTDADKIELLWSYKSDRVPGFNMDFIEKSNGIKKYPKHGDSFCDYTLINDSVIKADYHFPEWVKKVNEIAKDSIFPAYWYLKKEDAL